jgi:hypothetical protein
VIAANPEQVYAMVARLDLMPERSPEAQRFEWLEGTPGAVGTSFRGWNKWLGLTWWTNGWVTDADPPRHFAFESSSIYGDRQEHTNRWTYDLTPHPEGTEVLETLEVLRLPIHLRALGPLLRVRVRRLEGAMAATLRRLAEECEAH